MNPMRRLSLLAASFILFSFVISCRNNSPNGKATDDPNAMSQNIVNIQASASTPPNGKLPKLAFNDTLFNFGTIIAGQKVSHSFIFKNAGEGDLIISGAAASCGCTKPEFPKGVIHPGDTGTISVTFDSSNKSGLVDKKITVSSNSVPPYKVLTITANIQPSNN